MHRRLPLVTVFLVLLLAACGGGSKGERSDPVRNVPADNGIRAKVQVAATPKAADFPAAQGRTLQDLANTMTAGPSLAMASSVLTTGESRLAFGVIGKDGSPIYGPTALYVAPSPD